MPLKLSLINYSCPLKIKLTDKNMNRADNSILLKNDVIGIFIDPDGGLKANLKSSDRNIKQRISE